MVYSGFMSLKVLVIDDDESFTKLLEKRLRSFKPDLELRNFTSLADVRTFFREHKEERFQLVFLDQHLPDGSGIELLVENWFEDLAVIAVSSDNAPEMAGENLKAGAMFFLNKMNLSEPLFKPLVLGILERNSIQQELTRTKLNTTRIETVRTLVSTLRHEINNPLGAVLGAAYLLKNSADLTADQKEAASLVESSGKRIKHVLDELCKAVSLEPTSKAEQKVFHIPGDAPWE